MKIIKFLAISFLIASVAYADSRGELTGLRMSEQLADYITRNMVNVNTSGNLVLPVASGKVMQVTVAKTPVAQINVNGLGVVPYVITPATNLTPVAGTNDIRGITIVATAAPTSATGALPASPLDGEEKWIYNSGANPFVVAALGTPVINLAANRRTIMATKTALRCRYSSNLLSWLCTAEAAALFPTPSA